MAAVDVQYYSWKIKKKLYKFYKAKDVLGGSPGLVVMGDDSC